jgi:hypothetical protein
MTTAPELQSQPYKIACGTVWGGIEPVSLYRGFRQNDTLFNPLRARDERRDQCLSMLEIGLEFGSWRRHRSAAIAAEIFLGQEFFAPFSDCERRVRLFWFARCTSTH